MLTDAAVKDVMERALTEDAPWGDLTTESLVPPETTVTAHLRAREPGLLCGSRVIELGFAPAEVTLHHHDGESFGVGATLATVIGPAQTILVVERTVLNVLQRLSATATLTARYVDAVRGTRARIVDTRKTTPGLRAMEKHAVWSGGGTNHRFSLSDAVLVKDNHLASLSADGVGMTEALTRVRDRVPFTTHIEVEVDRLDQIEPVLASGVIDSLLLDNFTVTDLRTAVDQIAGRCLTNASGGVTLESVREISETGVDLISVGALTHSAGVLDIGLDFEVDNS